MSRDLLRPEVRAERMREAESAIAELGRIRSRNAPRRQLYMSAGRSPVDEPPQYVMRSAALTPESTQTDFERAATAGANFLDLEGAAEFGRRMRRIVNSTGAGDWIPWGSREKADADDFVHAGAAAATVGLLRGVGRYGGQRPVKSGGGLSYRAPKTLARAKTKVAAQQTLNGWQQKVAEADDEFISVRSKAAKDVAASDVNTRVAVDAAARGASVTGDEAFAVDRIKGLIAADRRVRVAAKASVDRARAEVNRRAADFAFAEEQAARKPESLELTPREQAAWTEYQKALEGASDRGVLGHYKRRQTPVSEPGLARKAAVGTAKFLFPWWPGRSLKSHAGHFLMWGAGAGIGVNAVFDQRAADKQAEYAAKSKALRYQDTVNKSTDAFRGIDPDAIALDVEARDPRSFYGALDVIKAANVARTHPNAAGTTNRVDEASIRGMVDSLPDRAWYNYGADRYKDLPVNERRKIKAKDEFDRDGMIRFGKDLFLSESTYEAGQRRKQEAERMMQGGGR